MVLLVQRLTKLYFKLENHLHHHHEPEALQASLQAFESHVSICLNKLSLKSNPGSDFLSFSWIQQCFELLPVITKAFAKLVVDIDYPMSKWEDNSVEEYLNYSLSLLEFLNSINSSVSHLGQGRLALFHALDLSEKSPSLAIERLKAIQLMGSTSSKNNFKYSEAQEDGEERLVFSDKERIFHLALREIKSIGFWVCGVILAGLSGDAKPYLEMKRPGGFSNSALNGLDSSVGEVINTGLVLKEVRELNDSAACLASAIEAGKSSDAAEELKRRLEAFEKLMDSVVKEVDHLFSRLLAGRNEVLDGIRKLN